MDATTLTLVVLAALAGLAKAQLPVPVIQSIASGGDDGLSVIWDVQDPQNKTLFTKYRVLVSIDGWLSSFEWPAQLKTVGFDSVEEPYRWLETRNNFECLNECIHDAQCKFAVRSSNQSGVNCFLKKEYVELRRATDPDTEYAFLNTYSQVAFLRHLSPNTNYAFKVAVFDSISAAWSDFSEPHSYEFSPVFDMKFVRTGVESGKLRWWNDYGHFFSRFGLLVSVNHSSFSEVVHLNPGSLTTFEHPSGYFAIEDFTKFVVAYDEQTCINACFADAQCVQLVYFTEDFKSAQGTVLAAKKSCYLNHKLDIRNGIYKKTNVVVLSVKETGHEYEFSEAARGIWEFHLESLNHYGVYHNDTAVVVYNLTDGTPGLKTASISSTVRITWELPEPLTLRRSAVYYTVNGSSEYTYSISESTDFVDPHERVSEVSSLNACFEECYKSTRCVAYTYNQEARQCLQKTKTDNPTPCQSGTVCATIPPVSYELALDVYYNTQYCFYAYATTTFGYTTPVGKLICLTPKSELSVEKLDKFLPGRTARLRCSAVEKNGQINWYRNLHPIDLAALNAQLSDDKTVLTFFNVTNRIHNGIYQCENVLNNSQVLISNNLDVQVKETAPMKPLNPHIMLTGTKERPSFQLRWDADAFTLPVSCINLYDSRDGVAFEMRTYCSPTLRGGVLLGNSTFTCKDTFMFQAANSVGNSEMSDLFHFDADECEDSPQKKSTAAYFGAFLSFLVLSILLGIAVLGLIIHNRPNSAFRLR